MRLGLLQCDHVLEDLLQVEGDYDAMFRRWLGGEWRIYDLTRGQAPQDLSECDGYVTTGSRASVYDDEPWIHGLAELVREIHSKQHPFLGVCFGHQMMAHALGGKVAKSERGWGIGVHEFRLVRQEPWMDPPLETLGVLMSCQDQVEDLPNGARVLGGNSHCPVGLYRIGSLLGIQGHPEWTPAFASALLSQRRTRIGAEAVDRALETMGNRRTSEEFAAWAFRWLQKPVVV